MASEQVIPLDALVDPIAKDDAVGVDIRQDNSPDSVYVSLKNARLAARAAERNNLHDSSNQEAESQWLRIIELAPTVLQNQSKDLEIAVWYTEALTRNYGFQGLRDGFNLIHGLIDRYWELIYPLPDEDGVEFRLASLAGLNGEGGEGVLIAPIRNIEITQGSKPGPFSFGRYQQALEINKAPDEETRKKMVDNRGFSSADVERAVSDSSVTFITNLVDDIDQAIVTYQAVGQLLNQHCGVNDSPPTSNIINTLQDCLGAVRHLGKHKLQQAESGGELECTSETGDTAIDRPATDISRGAPGSREEAFRRLVEISVFFRNTEPHSPISYILERAVKWGDLSLEELTKELIPESGARKTYGSLTGIRIDDD